MRLLESLSRAHAQLWVKHDDQTHPRYGGNKVRKLGRLFEDARARGKDAVVTLGAAGSHHVLSVSVFGPSAGLRVEAVLVQQPRTTHVVENLRAQVAQGATLYPASSYAHAAALLASRVARGAYYIPPGGSNRLGALGYIDAAAELADQVRRGELPEPDVIIVPMGSGGTAAGLTVGVARAGLRSRILAVTVAEPAWILERAVRSLVARCAQGDRANILQSMEQTRRYLGAGYGHGTPEGARATELAESVGLTLDPTYTAKAFAAALDRIAQSHGRACTVLYWHTLSSAPLGPLLEGAPDEEALDPRLRRLAR